MSNIKRKLEFFFDCSSPWTYLAFKEIEKLCSRLNLELVWKPILVGGIFNTINPSVYESRSNPVKPKASYSRKDLNDWSLIRGITVNWPDVFPVNSVKAMRGVLFALERNKVSEYVELVFCSYWTNNLDISLDEVLIKIVEELGWSSDKFISFINLESTKEALKLNTEELAKRGGFGSPTMFVDDENMFFGNDRLNLIEELLYR
ncbi:MAG TPA: 2-hydroxychromene-2-carboxylate isomerase [Gammaproteobacteria bacterium]|nr:2-hydroxychromene-2-carboxylate isomerase [Gammaproteobacteria bacterium]